MASPQPGASPSRRQSTIAVKRNTLLDTLTVFQATRLKLLMGDGKHTVGQFTETFFKAVNSVAFYKQRAEIELQLDAVFREYDADSDRRVEFGDLPMNAVLRGLAGGPPPSAEVVVFNDVPVHVLLAPEGGTVGGAAGGAAPPPRQATAASHFRQMEAYRATLDLAQCGAITYHEELDKHSMSHLKDVVIFDLGPNHATVELAAVLLGHHTAPVLVTLHVPHVRKLFTAASDRSIAAWNDADRCAVQESVRSVSPQTCMVYDPVEQQLVTGGTDGIICLFPVLPQLSHCVRTVKAHTEWITGLITVVDIDALVTCSGDGTLKIWDRVSLTLRSTKDPPRGRRLSNMVYSSNLRGIFTCAGLGREVLMWSPFLPAPTETLRAHDKPVIALHTSPSSPVLITVDQSGRVNVWDMRKSQIVQTLGAPDSMAPLGQVASLCYNTRLSAIVTLGDRLNVLLPQKGTHSAFLDAAVAVVLVCPITKNIYVAAGPRIVVFNMDDGRMVMSHNLGTLEVASMALGAATNTLIVGTHEGTAFVLTVGAWLIATQMFVEDAVVFVRDLGAHTKMHFLSPEHPRALAVTANGNVWHFAHGPMSDGVEGSTTVLHTDIEGVQCVALSTAHMYLYLSRHGVMEVWDLISEIRKPSLTVQSGLGWITALECSDDCGAVFLASSTGTVAAHHYTTSVPLFTIDIPGALVAAQLCFNRLSWTLSVSAPTALTSVQLRPGTRQREAHIAAISANFVVTGDVFGGRYEVDLTFDALVQPIRLRCRRRKKQRFGEVVFASVRQLLICVAMPTAAGPANQPALLARLQLLQALQKRLPRDATRCVARLHDCAVVAAEERVTDRGAAQSVYAVFERCQAPAAAAQEHLHELEDACLKRSNRQVAADVLDEQRREVREELRWVMLCAARAVQQLAATGHVPAAFDVSRDMRRCHDVYRWFGAGGVLPAEPSLEERGWINTGPVGHQPPEETTKRRPTVASAMWGIGLFAYNVCCRRPLFPPSASQAEVDRAFRAAFFRDATTDKSARQVFVTAGALRDLMRVSVFKEDWVISAITHLLCSTHTRWSPDQLIDALGCDAPRHLSCLKMPAAHDVLIPLVVDPDEEGIMLPTVPVSLVNADISAAAVCDPPFVYVAAQFNGTSAHIVLCDYDGEALGIAPPNNELRIPWTIGVAEVSSTAQRSGNDNSTVQQQPANGADDGEAEDGAASPGGNVEALSVVVARGRVRDDPMGRYCPFYTSTKGGVKQAQPMPYYMEGWHRNGTMATMLRPGGSRLQQELNQHLRDQVQAVDDFQRVKAEQQRAVARAAAVERETGGATPRSRRALQLAKYQRGLTLAGLEAVADGEAKPDPVLFMRAMPDSKTMKSLSRHQADLSPNRGGGNTVGFAPKQTL
jgi:WD40 repeat protein